MLCVSQEGQATGAGLAPWPESKTKGVCLHAFSCVGYINQSCRLDPKLGWTRSAESHVFFPWKNKRAEV